MTALPIRAMIATRRDALRAGCVCLALRWLETFAPAAVQRFVCVANSFSLIHDSFFLTEEGGVVPPISQVSRIFKTLFVDDPAGAAAQPPSIAWNTLPTLSLEQARE